MDRGFRHRLSIIGITLLLFSTLALVLAREVHAKGGLMLMAKKIAGEMPTGPADGAWGGAAALDIPLAPQAMAKPRIYEATVKNLSVRALHNGRDIAFLIEWDDRTEDILLDEDKFADAVALQFPSAAAKEKPHFAMGDRENSVNIWFWKASWREQTNITKSYAVADDFVGGTLAGNPISERKTPVENIVAQGFGSATDMEKSAVQNVSGSGTWQSNRWAVVFKRALTSQNKLDVSFREGTVTPVAFALWNGSDGNRGGRKALSTWYYVGLETEEKKTLFLFPLLAFLMAAAVMAGVVIGLRKGRG